jgi:hypothetical protein
VLRVPYQLGIRYAATVCEGLGGARLGRNTAGGCKEGGVE